MKKATPLAGSRLPQSKRFHAPVELEDSPTQTLGCRHTNPDICRRNGLPASCAFVRTDGMCLAPPASWPKQYALLAKKANKL